MNRETSDTEWSPPEGCRAVVVYDDLATRQRAEELWENIVNDMGHDVRCGVKYIPGQQIENAPLLERAEKIDVVIISMHDLARSLSTIAGWLADWLNADTCLPRALFVLHDGEEDRQLVNFLRTLAEFAGVTMLSCGHGIRRGPRAASPKRSRADEELLAVVA